jgi:hypothetical protein
MLLETYERSQFRRLSTLPQGVIRLTTNPSKTDTEPGTLLARSDDASKCAMLAIVRGGVGFALVSLAAFGVWALGGKWFQAHLGEAGLYGACALVFLVFSGLLLHPLVPGPRSFLNFYGVFLPSFLAYAVIWCGAWFILRFGLGEWLASFMGTTAFVTICGWRLGNYRGFAKAIVVLFVLHSAGYFLGGKLMYWIAGPNGSALLNGLSKNGISISAKLSWGLLYGLGFGAGIGYTFHTLQTERRKAPQSVPSHA